MRTETTIFSNRRATSLRHALLASIVVTTAFACSDENNAATPEAGAPLTDGGSVTDSGTPATDSGSGALALPRIPWEGGPDYWKQFSKADAAGWSNPSFFPILAFFEQFSSDAEVKFDKGLGINTYVGLNSTTDFSLLPANQMFYIGESLNATFDASSA